MTKRLKLTVAVVLVCVAVVIVLLTGDYHEPLSLTDGVRPVNIAPLPPRREAKSATSFVSEIKNVSHTLWPAVRRLGRATVSAIAVVALPGNKRPYTKPPPLVHTEVDAPKDILAMRTAPSWVFVPRRHLRPTTTNPYEAAAQGCYHNMSTYTEDISDGAPPRLIECYRIEAHRDATFDGAGCDWNWVPTAWRGDYGVVSINKEVLQVPPSIPSSVAAFAPPPPSACSSNDDLVNASTTPLERALLRLRQVTFQLEDSRPQGPRVAVAPMGCLAQYAHQLGRAPVIVMFGHSHQRLMGAMLCMMWNLTECHQFKKMLNHVGNGQTEDHTTRRTVQTPWGSPPTTLAFIRATQGARERTGREDPLLWTNVVGASAPTSNPDVVVYGRGAWDLVFWGTLPGELIAALTDDFVALHKALPVDSRLVLYLLHFTQPMPPSAPRRDQVGFHPWQKVLREMCLSEERTQAVRIATLCAIKAAHQKLLREALNGLHTGRSLLDRLEIFDVYHETSTIPSDWVKPLTDFGGHHYLDVILEAMAQKLLRRHVCPVEGLQHNHTLDAYLSVASEEVCLKLSECTSPGACLAETGWGGMDPIDHCSCKGPRRVERICSKY